MINKTPSFFIFFFVFFCCLTFNWPFFQAEASQKKIGNVQINGAVRINESKLMPIFQQIQAFPSDEFQAALLRLTHIYNELGFYDFRIDSIQCSYVEKETCYLVLYLHEGEKYCLSTISFLGVPESEKATLQQQLNIREGDVFSSTKVEDEIQELLEVYEQNGKPFAKIYPQVEESIHETQAHGLFKKVHLTFVIDEGPWVEITGYSIQGLERTDETVVTREFNIAQGENFNVEKFNSIQRNVEQLGFFESVSQPELITLSEKKLAPSDTVSGIICLSVKEGNPNVFDGIIGYQPEEDESSGYFTGYINIILRNMFGSGRKLQLEWSKQSEETQEVTMQYHEPWFLNIPLALTFKLHQLKQDSSYSQMELGLSASYEISEDLYITGTITRNAITPIVESESQTADVLESQTITAGFGILYDTRDFVQNPTSGIKFSNEYQFGSKHISSPDSVLEDYDVKRDISQKQVILDFEAYFQTFQRQVLATALHGKALIAEEIELGDLYRFGGSKDLRGYREEQFAASQLIYTNLEYRFLLSRTTFAFLFFDAGYYYKPKNPLDNESESFDAYKTAFGLGTRLNSPLGIISVSYALGENTSILNGFVHFGLINEF
nr:BamA/TamA family outer membrane protein [Chloroherpeton thalassium]